MVKYLSGRVKRTPQDQLKEDRYQYLNLEQAEPNLSDPLIGPTPPPGGQYQLIAIPGYPGQRFWVPVGGGLIPGAITIFDEGVQVSAASSITAKDTVRFDTNSSRILAFTKTFTGSSNTPEFTTTATTASGFQPQNTIGNLYSSFKVVANATGTGKSIALRSGFGNTSQIGDVSLSSKFLKGPSISSTLGDYVEITGIDKANDTIAVSEDVNFTAGDFFEVIEDPRSSAITTGNSEIDVIHVQGNHVNASPDTCTISGYLYINSIPANISLPINIDTLITTS